MWREGGQYDLKANNFAVQTKMSTMTYMRTNPIVVGTASPDGGGGDTGTTDLSPVISRLDSQATIALRSETTVETIKTMLVQLTSRLDQLETLCEIVRQGVSRMETAVTNLQTGGGDTALLIAEVQGTRTVVDALAVDLQSIDDKVSGALPAAELHAEVMGAIGDAVAQVGETRAEVIRVSNVLTPEYYLPDAVPTPAFVQNMGAANHEIRLISSQPIPWSCVRVYTKTSGVITYPIVISDYQQLPPTNIVGFQDDLGLYSPTSATFQLLWTAAGGTYTPRGTLRLIMTAMTKEEYLLQADPAQGIPTNISVALNLFDNTIVGIRSGYGWVHVRRSTMLV